MNDKHKPAVGYIRMSSDQQQDSPARQRQDIQALAERLGYQIFKWYEDHGLTGTESSKRKDFQKLLTDAKAGAFRAVLLSEQSRMSREDVFDAMVHWKLLRDAGVKIVTFQRGELDFSRASYGSIARDLNRSGFTTIFGKPFNATAVRRTVSAFERAQRAIRRKYRVPKAPTPNAVNDI